MTPPSQGLDPENIEIVEPVTGSRYPAHLIQIIAYLQRHLG